MSAKIPSRILKEIKKYPEFSQKIWIECAKIPHGETISYGELARRIGHPCAARAVGSVLANNPFAPIIPCHRIVRSDGKIGGYSARGGVPKKLSILKSERNKRLLIKLRG